MGYFNYFIRCIIRRFVKLFFTRKTFIVILVFLLVFILSYKSFAYGVSSDKVLVGFAASFWTNSSHSEIYRYSRVDLGFTVPFTCSVYELKPDFEYYSIYDFDAYYTLDSDIFAFIMNNTNIEKLVSIYSSHFIKDFHFSPSTTVYVLVPVGVDNVNPFRMVYDSVTSSDVSGVTNSVIDSSKQVQNSIEDSSQKMQNTITDSNVEVSTDLPSNDTEDITVSGFDSVFTTIRETFTSDSSKDLVLDIPFTDKSFTINFDNVYRWF